MHESGTSRPSDPSRNCLRRPTVLHPRPAAARSPQPAAGLAWPGAARGWSVAQAGRGTGRTRQFEAFEVHSAVIQSSISSKTSNCHSSCLHRASPASLRRCSRCLTASLRTASESLSTRTRRPLGLVLIPTPPTLLCRNARRRHGSRACPTLTLAPCSHRTAETNLENRPSSQHHTIAPSHYRIIASFASIAPLCAASREREGHKHLFDSSFPILEIRRGPHPREHVRPSVLGFPCAFYSMRSGSMRCVVPETMSLGHAIHPTTQLSPWGCCPRTHSQQPKTSRCRVAPVKFPLTRLCPGRGTPAVVSTAIVDYPGRLAKGLPSASAATAARSIPTPTAAAHPRIPGATHPGFRPAGMASATPCPESSLRAAPRR